MLNRFYFIVWKNLRKYLISRAHSIKMELRQCNVVASLHSPLPSKPWRIEKRGFTLSFDGTLHLLCILLPAEAKLWYMLVFYACQTHVKVFIYTSTSQKMKRRLRQRVLLEIRHKQHQNYNTNINFFY